MTRIVPALGLSLLLVACGAKSDEPAASTGSTTPAAPAAPTVSPTTAGADGARAAVEAYLVAAKKLDESAMLALGTAEWQQKEKTWKKAFTRNILQAGFALKSYDIRDPELDGDKATVSVRALFSDKGKDDREGMRFSLERRDGRWWITELH